MSDKNISKIGVKLTGHADIYHMWVNGICLLGALFFFNIWTAVKKHHGEGFFLKIMRSPVLHNINSSTSECNSLAQ